MTDQNEANPAPVEKKRNSILLKMVTVLFIATILFFFYWLFFIRFHATTDDAYVSGNNVILMAPENGIVVSIHADDTDYVERGQVLVELDPTLYQLAFDKSKVDLALAARQAKQQYDDVKQKEAEVRLRNAEYQRAEEDFNSRYSISGTAAVSQEDVNHARANLLVAKASVALAQSQLDTSISNLGTTPLREHPLIQNSAVALKEAYVNLVRRSIRAPTSGFVAKRNVQLGEWVTPSRQMLSIIPLEEIWVDANFKETEISDLRIGQPVSVTTDLYGSGVSYSGHVAGITAGTGSAFSLIPPQNATGNWIKIVQRVPVRVILDKEHLKKNPLVLGLSAYVDVYTKDISGERLISKSIQVPRLQTPIYEVPMDEVDRLIEQIITENLGVVSKSENGLK